MIAYDPYVSELKLTVERVESVSFERLLERSDYLSLHPPHNEKTHHMLSDIQFRAMKNTIVGTLATVHDGARTESLRGEKL